MKTTNIIRLIFLVLGIVVVGGLTKGIIENSEKKTKKSTIIKPSQNNKNSSTNSHLIDDEKIEKNNLTHLNILDDISEEYPMGAHYKILLGNQQNTAIQILRERYYDFYKTYDEGEYKVISYEKNGSRCFLYTINSIVMKIEWVCWFDGDTYREEDFSKRIEQNLELENNLKPTYKCHHNLSYLLYYDLGNNIYLKFDTSFRIKGFLELNAYTVSFCVYTFMYADEAKKEIDLLKSEKKK